MSVRYHFSTERVVSYAHGGVGAPPLTQASSTMAAAMTTSPDRYRMSRDSAARNIARTSSSVGARTGSGNSARVKTGSSVSVTGLGSVFPLPLRAKRHARWRPEREYRMVSRPTPSAFSFRKNRLTS